MVDEKDKLQKLTALLQTATEVAEELESAENERETIEDLAGAVILGERALSPELAHELFNALGFDLVGKIADILSAIGGTLDDGDDWHERTITATEQWLGLYASLLWDVPFGCVACVDEEKDSAAVLAGWVKLIEGELEDLPESLVNWVDRYDDTGAPTDEQFVVWAKRLAGAIKKSLNAGR